MVQILISAAAFIFCAQPEPRPFWANAEGGPLRHDPFQALLQRPPAPSPFLGISGATSNAARPRRRQRGPKPSPPPPIAAGKYVYTFKDGFLPVGSDLGSLHITQPLQAAKACAALIACHGFTFSHAGPNGTVNTSNPFPTRALLKGGSTGTTTFNNDHGWVSWIKAAAKVSKPALSLTFDGINIALREDTFAVQWINASGANYSFTPPLTPATALPLIQHLGDMTMRVRAAAGEGAANDDNKQPPWRYFATAWGAMSAKATALPLNPSRRERASHDVTPLLAATNASILLQPSMRLPAPPSEWHGAPPLRVTRAYRDPKKTSSSSSSAGFELTFTLTNVVTHAIEIGSFGMATPAAEGGAGTLKKNVAIDAHIGGDHGWVEWVRVVVDERCMIATPLLSASSTRSSLEAWRPIFEFGVGHGMGGESAVAVFVYASWPQRNGDLAASEEPMAELGRRWRHRRGPNDKHNTLESSDLESPQTRRVSDVWHAIHRLHGWTSNTRCGVERSGRAGVACSPGVYALHGNDDCAALCDTREWCWRRDCDWRIFVKHIGAANREIGDDERNYDHVYAQARGPRSRADRCYTLGWFHSSCAIHGAAAVHNAARAAREALEHRGVAPRRRWS